jgi:Asp-tRNA(Asn)/Glu-tRNA(Gln) amidotransferase A subunit family amidase
MNEDELAFLSIRELGALLRSGDISPTKLTEMCLRRLDDVGRRLNSVVTLTEDVARREAALAEAELHAGLDRGPLHGIPYRLKDIISATGAPTTWGAFADQRFEQEATVTRKLRDAGAILLAKVATIELAGGMGYDNPNASITGAPGNPWHTRKWTNGSSSGPSAVVGAGVLPFAIGSDTGGSILLPAAFTGTAGLRATYGRVSRAGAMTLCWTLDRLGPMCRSADDCGLVLEAIAGPDPRDPSSLTEPYRYRRPRPRPRREGFRFGVVAGSCAGAEPEVSANFTASLALLGEIGTLEEVELPELPYNDVAEIVIGAEAYAAFDEFIAAGGTTGLTAGEGAGAPARRCRVAGPRLHPRTADPPRDRRRVRRTRKPLRRTRRALHRRGGLGPRGGLRIHGTPFDAAAVVANIHYITDKATQSNIALGLLGPCTTATATTQYTVTIGCSTPYAPLLAQLGEPYLGMQSPAAIKQYGKDLGLHPVGTGPFTFVSYTPNQSVVLKRNEDYQWGPAATNHAGPPDIAQLTFQIVPSSQSRVSQFQSGQSDFMQEPRASSGTPCRRPAATTLSGSRSAGWAFSRRSTPAAGPPATRPSARRSCTPSTSPAPSRSPTTACSRPATPRCRRAWSATTPRWRIPTLTTPPRPRRHCRRAAGRRSTGPTRRTASR